MGTQKLRWSRELRERIEESEIINEAYRAGKRQYPYYFTLPVYLPTKENAKRKKYYKSDFRPEWWQYRENGIVSEGWWVPKRRKKSKRCRICIDWNGFLVEEKEVTGYDPYPGDFSINLYKERKRGRKKHE